MLQVAVAAYSGPPPPEAVMAAHSLVEALASRCGQVTILLGGYRGLMRVVADAALDRGLRVVFVIPQRYEADEYPESSVVIRTGLDVRERSSILVRSGDALVVLGGGLGTLFEAFIACSYGIPVYYLRVGTDFVTDRFAECFRDGVIDSRVGCRFSYFSAPADLVEALCNRGGAVHVQR